MSRVLALALVVAGGAAMAEPVEGAVYVCPSPGDLPAVNVAVGRVETSEELGVPAGAAGLTSVHVQVRVDGDEGSQRVGHMPFDVSAFAACRAGAPIARLEDGVTFQEGYQTWRAAFDKDEAGVFTVDPADIYWSLLGMLPSGGVEAWPLQDGSSQ